jgi:hypothetical protein
MIQNHEDNTQIATIHQKITHDLVLDIYEQAIHEDDPVKREAIIATAKVLSENIGEYLTDTPADLEKE